MRKETGAVTQWKNICMCEVLGSIPGTSEIANNSVKNSSLMMMMMIARHLSFQSSTGGIDNANAIPKIVHGATNERKFGLRANFFRMRC